MLNIPNSVKVNDNIFFRDQAAIRYDYDTNELSIVNQNVSLMTFTSTGVTSALPIASTDTVISGSLDVTGNLTVATDLLYVDTVNTRVGINTTEPLTTLDVIGNVLSTSLGFYNNPLSTAAPTETNVVLGDGSYLLNPFALGLAVHGNGVLSSSEEGRMFISTGPDVPHYFFNNSSNTSIPIMGIIRPTYTLATTTDVVPFLTLYSGSGIFITDGDLTPNSAVTALGYIADSNTGIAIFDTSSIKLKENVRELNKDSYDIIRNLRSVQYDWKNKSRGKNVSGWIAEEVEEYLPELVHLDKDSNTKFLNKSGLVPVLWGAVRTLISKVESLESRIESLLSSSNRDMDNEESSNRDMGNEEKEESHEKKSKRSKKTKKDKKDKSHENKESHESHESLEEQSESNENKESNEVNKEEENSNKNV